jgi:hypothetical protein
MNRFCVRVTLRHASVTPRHGQIRQEKAPSRTDTDEEQGVSQAALNRLAAALVPLGIKEPRFAHSLPCACRGLGSGALILMDFFLMVLDVDGGLNGETVWATAQRFG